RPARPQGGRDRSGLVGAERAGATRFGLGHQDTRDAASPTQSSGAVGLTEPLPRIPPDVAQQCFARSRILQRPEDPEAHACRRAPCDFGLVDDAAVGLHQIEVLGHAVRACNADVRAPVRLIVDRAVDDGMALSEDELSLLQDTPSWASALVLWILGRAARQGIGSERGSGGALSHGLSFRPDDLPSLTPKAEA